MKHIVTVLFIIMSCSYLTVTHVFAQQSPITVVNSNALPDFPNSITFSLSAESSDAPIDEVQLLYGAAGLESMTIVHATFQPGTQVRATHTLDTQIFYMPPGVDIAYRWIIQNSAGSQLETPLQTLSYRDQRFAWQQRTAQNVTVHWYEGNNAFGEELIDAATDALDRLQEQIGAQLTKPVNIYIYANNRDLRSALQSNEAEWVGGQSQDALGIITAAIAEGDRSEVRRIIPHELSHQVLHQATDNPYGGLPLWFNEGLAVYNQEVQLKSERLALDSAARSGQLIPLEALAASFPADPEQATLSYAQSHSVVSYIIDTYGVEGTQKLVAAFQEAQPLDEALKTSLGLTIDELDEAWRKTLPKPTTTTAPTDSAIPVAPADRFSNSLSTQPGTTPPFNTTDPFQPTPVSPFQTMVPGLSLPLWAELGIALGCCTVLITFMGATLLVVLRLVGVDKRG